MTVTATVGGAPGDLDTNFHDTGVVTIAGPYESAADAVLVDDAGRVVVAAVASGHIDIYRLTSGGIPDPSWNDGAPYVWQGAGTEGGAPKAGIAQDNAGRVYVTSAVELNNGQHAAVAVLRLTPNGAPDENWGGPDGIVRYHFGGFKNDHGSAVVVDDSRSRVYVGAQEGPDPAPGNSGADFAVTALNLANGAIDTTFGHKGSATVDFNGGDDTLRDLALMPKTGDVLGVGYVASSQTGPSDTGLWMLTPTGAADATFGGNGRIEADFGSGAGDGGRSVSVNDAGRIYVSGYDGQGSGHGYVAAFRSDGVLRGVFDGHGGTNGGFVRSDFGASSGNGFGLALDADGRIVTTGVAGGAPGVGRFVDAAYAVDTTFAGTGSETLPCAAGSGSGEGIGIQPDAKVVVAGVCGSDLRIWRLNGGNDVTPPAAPSVAGPPTLTASHVSFLDASSETTGQQTTTAQSGAIVGLQFDWNLTGGTGNDQMVVGLVDSGPTDCANLSAASGTYSGSFTVPTTPGRYYLAFDLLHQGSCTPLQWSADAPPATQYLASIDVTSGEATSTTGHVSGMHLTATATDGAAWPGALATAVNRISLNDLAGTLDTLTAAPLRGSPLRGSPLRGSPLRGSPLRGSPLRGSPLRGSPLAAPLRGSPIPLSDLPLAFGQSWSDLLGDTLNVPIQNATLNDVFNVTPVPPGIASLTLADIDWNSTPLRNVSLIAFLLAGVPAGQLDTQPGPLPAGTDPTQDFLTNELNGIDFADFYANGIELAGQNLGHSPLANVQLGDMLLQDTPFGDIATSSVPAGWVTCGTTCAPTLAGVQSADVGSGLTASATVGALLLLHTVPSNTASPLVVTTATMGGLLPGLLSRDQLPYAGISPFRVATAAPIRTTNLVSYEANFTMTCSSPAVADPVVEFALPAHFRYVPGSATFSLGDVTVSKPTAPVDAVDVTGHLTAPCPAGTAATVRIKAEPGLDLGPATATASASYADDPPTSDSATVSVVDNSGQVSATPDASGDTSTVFLGRISQPGQLDTFTIPNVPAGAALTVSLAHVPAGQDYDLAVFGPETPSLRNSTTASPLRGSPLRGSGVPDTSTAPSSDGTSAPPEPLNDVPTDPPTGDSVWGVSDNRGSVPESVALNSPDGSAGAVTIQVSGYNGSSAPDTYSLAVSVAPQNPPTCGNSMPALNTANNGAAPSGNTTSPETLILTDQERLTALYGSSAASGAMSKLNALAQKVNGLVVPVENNAAVSSAYGDWIAHQCSPAKANAVVKAINAYVDSLRGPNGFPALKYLVVAGGDLVVPMARLADHVALDNEDTYANDEVYNNHENPLSAALRDGYLLSDDPYGDFNPFDWLDGQAFVPDVAVGRLIETPDDINAAVDAFINSGGVRSPNSAYTAGYDFNADGSQQVADTLAPRVGSSTATINGSWTKADALAGMAASAHGYLSINAHYDAYRALPANEFTSGTQSDLLTTGSSGLPTDFSGSVLFTIGCHAGLNVADTFVAATTAEAAQQADWPQTFLHRGASGYAANTGYGYGDSVAVAYSEKLMADVAKNLDGSMTVGQALMFAKQSYLHLPLAAVDAKVSEEATFYGLPMYRLGTSGKSANPIMPSPATTTTPATITTASVSQHDDFTNASGRHLVVQHSGQGDYYVVQTGSNPPQSPYALPGRPLQPQTSDTVTPPGGGLTAHGSVITALTTHVTGPLDPVYSAAVPDGSGLTPEPGIKAAFFPANTLGLVSRATPAGNATDVVVVNAGQFRSSGTTALGYQQLTDGIDYQTRYSNSPDFVPPTIYSVNGTVSGGSASFTVHAADNPGGTGIDDVSVLYLVHGSTSPTAWHLVHLVAGAGDTYTASDPLPAGSTVVEQFMVQVSDKAQNVATSTSKGRDFRADLAPTSGHPAITLDGAETAGGFSGPVTVTLSGAQPLSYRLDGGSPTPYDGPFVVTAAGSHVIVASDGGGDTTTTGFSIDSSPPTVSISSPLQGGTYGVGQPILGVYGCEGDPPVSCVASPATPDNTAGQHTFTVTATDAHGRNASASVTYTVGNSMRFTGYFQPINDPAAPMSVWKLGSTIPVKFQLLTSGGTPISDTVAAALAANCQAKLVSPTKVSTTSAGVDEALITVSADAGGCFRYDVTGHQFIYNLSSKSLPNANSGDVWQLRTVVYSTPAPFTGRLADHSVLVALK